jgi:hypothetical protein
MKPMYGIKVRRLILVQGLMPAISAMQEAEAGGLQLRPAPGKKLKTLSEK